MNFLLHDNVFVAFYRSIIDLLYPNSCFICQHLLPQQELLCPACFFASAKLNAQKIGKNGQLEVFSLFKYQEPFNKLITSKFSAQTRAFDLLGRLIWQTPGLQQTIADSGIKSWYLVAVPLHWQRQWWRGFNQAQVLANALGDASGFSLLNALYRHKNTKPQTMTDSKVERQQNLAGAIKLNIERFFGGFKLQVLKNQVTGSGIIIVDDLLTSGSTLLECQKQLKQLNPAKIIAVTACRG